MSIEHGGRRASDEGRDEVRSSGAAGKRTRTESLPVQRRSSSSEREAAPPAAEPARSTAIERGEDPFAMHLIGSPVQMRGDGAAASDHVHEAAAAGTAGTGGALPYAAEIQRSFGRHDVSQIQSHTGEQAANASRSMGAEAFAVGNHVAFRDAPSLHTAAHEAAHVVQQRAGVHLAGGVGKEGDVYEQHADAVADLVVQGKSAEGLLDQHAGGSSSGGAGAVQRKVDSHYGEWHDDDYKISSSGTRHSVKMDLRWKPKPGVDAELVGLTQTVKTVKGGSAYYINNNQTTKDHSIKAADAKTINGASDEGTHIDQADYNRNPLYAAEGAADGDTKLSDTLPDPDKTKKNTWGRHGWYYTDGGALKEQDALLFDETGLNDSAKDSEQIFETTALAISGNQKDTYYGSVEWGWRTDGSGTYTKIPMKVVSEGVPSSTFLKSAEIWNAGQTKDGKSTLDLPTVDVKIAKVPITQKLPPEFIGPPLQIPKGTRVQVLTAPAGGKNGKIKVVDGVFVGTQLEIDATDHGNLDDERS